MISAERELIIRAPLAVVWALLTDIESWQDWQPNIVGPGLGSALSIGARFHYKVAGIGYSAEIHALRVQKRIAWSGKAIGIKANHAWGLSLTNGVVAIKTEKRMSGWRVGLFKNSMQKRLVATLDDWLLSLKTEAENRNRSAES